MQELQQEILQRLKMRVYLLQRPKCLKYFLDAPLSEMQDQIMMLLKLEIVSIRESMEELTNTQKTTGNISCLNKSSHTGRCSSYESCTKNGSRYRIQPWVLSGVSWSYKRLETATQEMASIHTLEHI